MSNKSRGAKLVGSCDARRDKMLLLESEPHDGLKL
jgi:hypothetical protein